MSRVKPLSFVSRRLWFNSGLMGIDIIRIKQAFSSESRDNLFALCTYQDAAFSM